MQKRMTLYTQKGKKKQGKISGYEFVSYLDLIGYCTINIPNGFEARKQLSPTQGAGFAAMPDHHEHGRVPGIYRFTTVYRLPASTGKTALNCSGYFDCHGPDTASRYIFPLPTPLTQSPGKNSMADRKFMTQDGRKKMTGFLQWYAGVFDGSEGEKSYIPILIRTGFIHPTNPP